MYTIYTRHDSSSRKRFTTLSLPIPEMRSTEMFSKKNEEKSSNLISRLLRTEMLTLCVYSVQPVQYT